MEADNSYFPDPPYFPSAEDLFGLDDATSLGSLFNDAPGEDGHNEPAPGLSPESSAIEDGEQAAANTPENHTPENHTPENHTPENHTLDNHTPENHTSEVHTFENHTSEVPPEISSSGDVSDIGKGSMLHNYLWSDIEAKQFKFDDLPHDEQRHQFDVMTGREVKIMDDSTAYARGHWPRSNTGAYLHLPECNPNNIYDITTYVPNDYGLAENSVANVPIVIAWIDDARMVLPHPQNAKPQHQLDEDGRPIIDINGVPLRDFRILPSSISSAVEGWRMHYWFTLDKRIGYSDILARMNFKCNERESEGPLYRGPREVVRVLHNRVDLYRRQNGILAPLHKHQLPFDFDEYKVTDADMQAIEGLTRTQLEYGTWWTVDEVKGVMYPPQPKDESIPWKKEQHILPFKAGLSPRVQKILEFRKVKQSPPAAHLPTPLATPSPPSRKRSNPTLTPSPPKRQRVLKQPVFVPKEVAKPNEGSFMGLSPIERAKKIMPGMGLDIPTVKHSYGVIRQNEALEKAWKRQKDQQTKRG